MFRPTHVHFTNWFQRFQKKFCSYSVFARTFIHVYQINNCINRWFFGEICVYEEIGFTLLTNYIALYCTIVVTYNTQKWLHGCVQVAQWTLYLILTAATRVRPLWSTVAVCEKALLCLHGHVDFLVTLHFINDPLMLCQRKIFIKVVELAYQSL